MSYRIKLLATTCVAVFALSGIAVASASAATPTFDPPGGKFSAPFTGKTSVAAPSVLRAGTLPTVTCKTTDPFNGEFTTGTTGDVRVAFAGCTESAAGTQCTTSGQSAGTITTSQLTFDLLYLHDGLKTLAGALLTPPSGGIFAEFACGFGLVHVTVKGNGVIGEITSPAFNTASNTFTLKFAPASAGSSVQKWQQNEETGTKFHLEASTGGAFQEASQEAESTATLTGGKGELTNT